MCYHRFIGGIIPGSYLNLVGNTGSGRKTFCYSIIGAIGVAVYIN